MSNIMVRTKRYIKWSVPLTLLLYLSLSVTIYASTYSGLLSLLSIGISGDNGRFIISNGIPSLFVIANEIGGNPAWPLPNAAPAAVGSNLAIVLFPILCLIAVFFVARKLMAETNFMLSMVILMVAIIICLALLASVVGVLSGLVSP